MEADHNQTLRENVQTVAWVQTAQTQSVHAATSSRTLKLRYISNMWGFSDVITLAEEPETDPLNCKHLYSLAGKRTLRNLNGNLQGTVIRHAPG